MRREKYLCYRVFLSEEMGNFEKISLKLTKASKNILRP